MEVPIIDETKPTESMEIIGRAASLMAERDCQDDPEAKAALETPQKRLEALTGNPAVRMSNFQRYWSAASLEDFKSNQRSLSGKRCAKTAF